MAVYALPRRVSWGDCDPAGILYTPRVFDYCTQALECWYAEVMDLDWITMNRDHNLGSPMVHAACDYLSPMAPGLHLAVEVWIEALGGSSLTFRLDGKDAAGTLYFRAKYVACITDFAQARAVPIPAGLRARAEAYRAGCSSCEENEPSITRP